MPIPYIPVPATPADPVYHPAPLDVDRYLRTRGWFSSGSNLWEHDNPDITGPQYQWPEALAYEIFQNFVMLKTSGE